MWQKSDFGSFVAKCSLLLAMIPWNFCQPEVQHMHWNCKHDISGFSDSSVLVSLNVVSTVTTVTGVTVEVRVICWLWYAICEGGCDICDMWYVKVVVKSLNGSQHIGASSFFIFLGAKFEDFHRSPLFVWAALASVVPYIFALALYKLLKARWWRPTRFDPIQLLSSQ